MGNYVTTGSRVSENGERAASGHLNDGSDETLKGNDVIMENVNDSGPIDDDYVMSEASSMVNTKQDSRENFEEEEEIDEDEEKEKEEIDGDEAEENGFHVGDFVWGEEVNCHQWWPGKIYDSSDASNLALKKMQKGKLLVAYFGNGTFAWCNPSQLKPFLENFKEFTKISDCRGFLNAVEEAVREIGEHVERLLACDEALVGSVAVNSGIKEGVLVPDVRREIVSSWLLDNPGIVLEDVKSLAKTVSFSDLLEIEVLKRKISVFYRCKGRFDLAKYDEDGYIIGLEDKEDEDALNFDKSSCERSLRKCSVFAREKRKYDDEVKGTLGDVSTTGSTSSTLRRRVSGVSKIENAHLKQVEEICNGKSLSPRKRKSKRDFEKREESNDSNHIEESEKKDDSGIEIVVDLSTPLASLCKRLKVDVSSSVERNTGNGETIVQTGKRERKKSKYLSPEYMTDFSCRARKSKTESESSQICVEERMMKNASEKAIDFVRMGASPNEMLDLIRAAALGTQYLNDYNSSCYMIREFISIYRSFTYHDGANNKIHNRKISDEDKEQTGNEPNETVDNNKRDVEKQFSGVELIIESGLGFTLPSKDDLIKTFKKFGALDKGRSFMFNNNSCANIPFLNASDGEEAFIESLEKCPFVTTSTVTFKLKYPSSDSPENTNEENKTETRTREGVIEIVCLKEKLEGMRSLLDQSEGGITEELKMKLEDELRNLRDKVSKMIVRSS